MHSTSHHSTSLSQQQQQQQQDGQLLSSSPSSSSAGAQANSSSSSSPNRKRNAWLGSRTGGTSLARSIAVAGVFVCYYYVVSTALIIYNKWLFSVHEFKFPLLVTTVHMFVLYVSTATILGCCRGGIPTIQRQLFWKRCVPLGVIVGADIAMSNLSYMYLEVHFMEMIKSTSPIWVLLISFCAGTEQPRWSLAFVIFTISAGLILATFGEAKFNWIGFTLCFSAAILVGFRLVLMQILLHTAEYKLDSITLLYLTAPVCGLTMLPFALILEGEKFIVSPFLQGDLLNHTILLVLGGAFLALNLNISEFLMLRQTSALTTNVIGVVKLLGIGVVSAVLFHAKISTLNVIGFGMCLVGVMIYNYLKLVRMGLIRRPWWDPVTPSSPSADVSRGKDESMVDEEEALLSSKNNVPMHDMSGASVPSMQHSDEDEEDQ